MLTLYAIPVSLYCAKLRIALRHKNLQWTELLPPGGYGSDAYRAIVPSGNLPALIDGDLLIGDSEAAIEYLNEAYPEPALLPAEPGDRATIRERSRFHDTRLEPAVRTLFPLITPTITAIDAENSAALSAALSEKLKQLGQILDRSRMDHDDGLALGDCGYPVTFAWLDDLASLLDLDLDWPQTVLDYRNSIERHAGVADELALYVPRLRAWLAERGEP